MGGLVAPNGARICTPVSTPVNERGISLEFRFKGIKGSEPLNLVIPRSREPAEGGQMTRDLLERARAQSGVSHTRSRAVARDDNRIQVL